MATRRHQILIELRAREQGLAASLKRGEAGLLSFRSSVTRATSALTAVGAVASTVGLVAIGRAFASGVAAAVKAADEQRAANVAAAQSIRNIGENVETMLPQVQRQAEAFQDLTGLADDMILRNQALLIGYGRLRGEGLERATRAALDLAATGVSQEAAFMLVAKAAAGYTGQLGRYGIVIDQTLPKSQRFEAALAGIEARVGGQAQAKLRTLEGTMLALRNRVGEVAEAIGGPLEESLRLAVGEGLTPLVERIEKALESSKELPLTFNAWAQSIVRLGITALTIADKVLPDFITELDNLDKVLKTLQASFRMGEKWGRVFLTSVGVGIDLMKDGSLSAEEMGLAIGSLAKPASASSTALDGLLASLEAVERRLRSGKPDVPEGDAGAPPGLDEDAATRAKQAADARIRLLEALASREDELSQAHFVIQAAAMQARHRQELADLGDNLKAKADLERAHGIELEELRRQHDLRVFDAAEQESRALRQARIEAIDAEASVVAVALERTLSARRAALDRQHQGELLAVTGHAKLVAEVQRQQLADLVGLDSEELQARLAAVDRETELRRQAMRQRHAGELEDAKENQKALDAIRARQGTELDELEAESAARKRGLLDEASAVALVNDQVMRLAENIRALDAAFQFSAEEFSDALAQRAQDLTDLSVRLYDEMTAGLSQAISNVVFAHENASDQIKAILEGLGRSVIEFLVRAAAQSIAASLLGHSLAVKQHLARMSQLSAQTYASAFAAIAAIPIVGPALAPGVAAASVKAMMAGSLASAAAGRAIGGATSGSGFAEGGQVGGPPGRDRSGPFWMTRGETVLDTTPVEGRAILSGRAAVVPVRGGGRAGGGDLHVHLTLQAFDSRDARDFLMHERRFIAEALSRAIDEGYEMGR